MKRNLSVLTPREIEALQLAADGNHAVDIARAWGYRKAEHSNDAGPSHVRRLWQQAAEKLGAEGLVQAVAMGIRRQIIT
jgi:DNA-binding NarL/FixJ family response regulator